jgi:hypothetical protein
MKTRIVVTVGVTALGALLIAGCGSVPKHPDTMTKEDILLQPDVKGKPPVVFQKGHEDVRQAGLRALVFVGCEIKTESPYFLCGRRPNKFGLFIGSGGETVKIFLYPKSETETHVWVDTDKSFVGLAGQQGWDKQVIEELTKLLNETRTSSSK